MTTRRPRRLALERLEDRALLAIDLVGPTPAEVGAEPDPDMVFVTTLPTDVGGVFTAGYPESDAAAAWIAAAAESTSGALVVWLKLTVHEGVTTMQAVPIWARWNPSAPASPPAHAAGLAATVDGLVFGGPGSPLGPTPLAFADLAGFTPPLETGTQEYFVVARSTSDFALAALSTALVMANLTDDESSAEPEHASPSEPATPGGPTDDEPVPEPLAWLARLHAERPFAAGGDPTAAFPAGPDGPVWLVDAQVGDAGAVVFWVTETMTADGFTVRALPVWLRFNPSSTADPLVSWTGDTPQSGSSTSLVYVGDPTAGGGPVPVHVFTATPLREGDSRTSLQVLRSTSNVELALTTVVVLLVQAPEWALGDMTGDGFVPTMSPTGDATILGSGGVLSALLSQAMLPAPEVALARDTGRSPTDRITSDGRLAVDTLPRFRAEYSTDQGRTWRRSFQARPGANAVLVRQVARGGPASPATLFEFTLDQRRPLSPQVTLAAGRNGERQVLTTVEGRLVAKGIEPDARLQVSVNGGPWRPTLTLGDRFASLRVRQVDVAGNVSRPSAAVSLWRILAAGAMQQAAMPSYSLAPRTRRA